MAQKRLLCRSIPVFFSVLLLLSSCGGTEFEITPPAWIYGVWQSNSTPERPEYVKWTFTVDSALYEYHHPELDIHTAIAVPADFEGRWVRDEETDDELELGYNVLIDRVRHHFWQQIDGENGEVADPTLVGYCAEAIMSSSCWGELVKQ